MGSGEEATAATEFQENFCAQIPFFLLSQFNFFMSEGNGQFPNSTKTFVSGKLYPNVRVPFSVIPSEVEGSLDISVCL